jgi:ABC-type transport system substrate-binding protein
VRVAVAASRPGVERLTPLSYRGGFQTKTPIYETLVRRDAAGRIVPGLASSWHVEDGGRTVVFRLREGARFHDGTPVDAESVRIHFKRWVGLPEHAWLGASERIASVAAPSPSEVRISLDRPYALLPDLVAINPCAIQGPGALDREGSFLRPVGSGPFRFAGAMDDGRVFRYALASEPEENAANRAASEVDLVLVSGGGSDPVMALLAGEVDVVADGWTEMVGRDRVASLRADERFDVLESAGSSVRYLSFRLGDGPTAERELRRRVAAAIDRDDLVLSVEAGHADPCATWAAPTVIDWPKSAGRPSVAATRQDSSVPPLRVVALRSEPREAALAERVSWQLARAGLPSTVAVLDDAAYRGAIARGEFDLRFERTWGVPYDPDLSLRARFRAPAATPDAASTSRSFGVDPRATEIVDRLDSAVLDADRRALYAEMQSQIDAEAVIVPLFVSRRLAVVRKGRGRLVLDHDIYRLDLAELLRSRE